MLPFQIVLHLEHNAMRTHDMWGASERREEGTLRPATLLTIVVFLVVVTVIILAGIGRHVGV